MLRARRMRVVKLEVNTKACPLEGVRIRFECVQELLSAWAALESPRLGNTAREVSPSREAVAGSRVAITQTNLMCVGTWH